MEKLSLTSSLGLNPTFAGAPISRRRSACQPFFLPAFQRGRLATARYKRLFVSAVKSNRTDSASSKNLFKNVFERLKFQGFASISSSGSDKVSTGTVTAPPVPPPPSYIGTPLFWVGIGVALSALFSVVVSKLKQYAMQQAFKTMMNQAGAPQGSGPFTNPAFPGGAPFPFPTMPPQGVPGPSKFPPPPTVERKESAVTVDVPTTKVEAPPPPKSSDEKIDEKDEKKFAFVDVSPEKKEVEYVPEPEKDASGTVEPEIVGSTNGAAFKTSDTVSSQQSQSQYQSQSQPSGGAPFLSVDALEKMMEDPTVQQMVYPYLPEEMRNPSTFKWMLQNPQYRQQLQDMLNNMGGGNSEWDSRMMDSLKNFDLSSPEVKQQFEQIGLTPQEVINKIMANPDVAVAFQNPRIQAAIMDCSQNPLNISKYQNDKEVMDVFNKIAELFPGVTG